MLEYNAQYAGYIFGNAWGAVSAAAHCEAAKARRLAGKNQYRLKNVDAQIAKFCEQARLEAEETELLFGAGDTGTSPSPSSAPFVGPPMLPPISPPPPADEGGIGLGIPLAILAVVGIGGAAGIYFLTKKPKKK